MATTDEELQQKAADYMRDIVAQIKEAKQLSKCDQLSLDILENNIYKYLAAERFIKENDIILYNSQGTAYENPANHVSTVALAKIMEICQQYGLTALSRKKLGSETIAETPIDALLQAAAAIRSIKPTKAPKKPTVKQPKSRKNET